MSNGYFRMPRSLIDDPLFMDLSDANKVLMMTILSHCTYAPRKFDDHGKIIDLQVGQLCISNRDLAELCGKKWTQNHVFRGLMKLGLCRFLIHEVIHKKSIITITHADTYDLIKSSSDSRSDSNSIQTRFLNKEGKEGKEEKEKIQKRKPGGGGVFFSHELQRFENTTEDWQKLMRETYPGVDIMQELRKMRLWLLQPQNLKYRGTQAFISKWLDKTAASMPKYEEEPLNSYIDPRLL